MCEVYVGKASSFCNHIIRVTWAHIVERLVLLNKLQELIVSGGRGK